MNIEIRNILIKIIQNRNEIKREEEEKMKKDEKEFKHVIGISKHVFEQFKIKKKKDFSGLIKKTYKEYKSAIKELDKMIELDKIQYQKDLEMMNPSLEVKNLYYCNHNI
jgi:predicted metalloendopeptidase